MISKLRILCSWIALVVGLQLHAQQSPSRQSNIVTPTYLSGCANDTVELQFTNLTGPSCPPTGPGTLATYTVTIPGTGIISYVGGSLSSVPAGVTFQSLVGNVLTFTVPMPALGSTTRVKFLVKNGCDITSLSPLPAFNVSVTYPSGFVPANESWTSAKSNTGVGTILVTQGDWFGGGINPTRAFNDGTGNYFDIRNTGYGDLTRIEYNFLLDDSIYLFYGPSNIILQYVWTAGYAQCQAPCGAWTEAQPSVVRTNTIVNGKRLYKYVFSGLSLGPDGRLQPGQILRLAQYFRVARSCVRPQLNKNWFKPLCVDGTAFCSPETDTFFTTIRINAGTPIISAVNKFSDTWDGCPNKRAWWTFVNTGNNGVKVPGRPEMHTAHDAKLVISLGGKLTLSSIVMRNNTSGFTYNLAGMLPPSTAGITGFTLDFKDKFNTDFDGAGGFTDADGDGFFDDIQPGDSMRVNFIWTLDCNLACGPSLYYDISGNSTFTDFCKNLNGASANRIYEFGFRQLTPISQFNVAGVFPNFGTLTNGQQATRRFAWSFNYRKININTTASTLKLRINYGKAFQVVDPIKIGTVTVPLSSFTQVGTGSLTTTSGTYNNTTDNDRAIEYTLPAALKDSLLSGFILDSLVYHMAMIACDSFQSQQNKNGWELLFNLNSTPCQPGSVPQCTLDLGCNQSPVYSVLTGCGTKPCYLGRTQLTRTERNSWTNANETTVFGAGSTKGYVGDTFTQVSRYYLNADWPIMENTGTYGSVASPANFAQSKGFQEYFSIAYFKNPGVVASNPLIFLNNVSRLRIIDTVTNTVLHDIPLRWDHFLNQYQYTKSSLQTNQPFAPFLNGNTPTTTINGYNSACASTSNWYTMNSGCPIFNYLYRGDPYYYWYENQAQTKGTEMYYLMIENAMLEAGINMNIGYAKYHIEIVKKWRASETFPWNNVGDFNISGGIQRVGNNDPYRPDGTRMGLCGGVVQTAGTVVTKDIEIPEQKKSYGNCGMTVNNKLNFKSVAGNYLSVVSGGFDETRVPYKLDSISITMPSEYGVTSGTLSYNGVAGAANNSATTGWVRFTNNTGITGTSYNDFPRFTDASGLTTVGNLQYTIANIAPNGTTDIYRVPVRYYVRDEWNRKTLLVDTIYINEGLADLTISAVPASLTLEDGGTCTNFYVDYLVANNTLYPAENSWIAARSSASSIVTRIEDVTTQVDPIVSPADISTWGGNSKQAFLGTIAPAQQRVVRVFYTGSACTDALKVYANFDCLPPVTPGPNYSSPRLDSATANVIAASPGLITNPLTPRIFVTNLCNEFTVELELKNTKNANLFNIRNGIKLPTNMQFVAGSFENKTVPVAKTTPTSPVPAYRSILAANITTVGTDSVSLNISADTMFTKGYCGLPGVDSALHSVVSVRFRIAYTGCPASTTNFLNYTFSGENFCGQSTLTSAVVNFVYTGNTGTPATYSCRAVPGSDIAVCAKKGETTRISDRLIVKNVGLGASNALDTMEITVGIDTGRMSLSNFSVGSPYSIFSSVINAQGRPVLKIPMPAGVAVNDSFFMNLQYDLRPKVDNVCNNPSASCADISHSVSFYSVPILSCPSKFSGTCLGSGRLTKGNGFVPRDLVCCAALGNYVWIDTDRDGIQDGDELPVAGVTVTLYNAAGQPIATTVTDAYGMYMFTDLIPGTYSVGFTPPTNYDITVQGTGTAADGSDANPATGRTAPITLAAGETNLNIDCGLVQAQPVKQSLGDRVWFDTDKDGVQDPTEDGIAGVTVTLYDNLGRPIATTVTDQNGNYLFDNIPTGTYSVGFTPPIGLVGTTLGAGTSETGSDMNPATFRTAPINVTTGQNIRDIDAGFYPQAENKCSLGNLVWNDLDNDGIQDADEPGVEGVTVVLRNAITNAIVATTKTDAYGNYIFNDLNPGSYNVTFSTLPSGFNFSPANTGGLPADSTDSDAGAGGVTGNYTLIAGERNLSVDAGIHKPGANYTLGNYVWIDTDKDGVQDATEAGVAGVMVILRNSSGTPIDTTYTDANGQYLFTNLAGGDYSVQVKNLPPGYEITGKDQTGDLLDNDANSFGVTPNVTLGPGNPNDRSLDIGITPNPSSSYTATLGNRIWYDGDNDGIQDAGEPGVVGVKVYLYAANGTTILDSTTTDGKGEYMFTNLPAGEYYVGARLPSGYNTSPKGAGTDSTADANGNAPIGGISKSDKVTLGPGQDNLTVDFGINKPSALIVGNKVWLDADKDGIQDAGEQGVSGIGVQLLDEFGNVVKITQTDADGNYLFTDVAPGNYRIKFTNLPSGYVFTAKDTSIASNITDSDASRNGGTTDLFTVNSSYTWTNDNTQTQLSYDAGIYPNTTAAVSGTYWIDNDKDGVQDAGEPGIAGMRVTLYNSSGVPVASTITDANGNYLFPNVTPGSNYTIGFEPPPNGTIFTQQNTPGTIAGTSNSDINPASGRTAPFNVTAGSVTPDIDGGVITPITGSLGDKVWFDRDYDGTQDANEPGIPGVVLELMDGSGNVIATTVSDANGNYLFSNLPAGNYQVRVASYPPGLQITRKDASGNDATDNDVDKNTRRTGVYTLNPGENIRHVDIGLSPIAFSTIGSYVFEDLNIDGVWNKAGTPTEPPAVGAKVYLWDNATNTIIDSVTTNAGGFYVFDSLPPGNYRVQVAKPGWKPTYQNVRNNTRDSMDSDVDVTTGFTGVYSLGTRDTNYFVWAGLVPAAVPLNAAQLGFAARGVSTTAVLKWSYSNEENIVGYKIYRSTVGSSVWSMVYATKARGTVNKVEEYITTDDLSEKAAGLYYYYVVADMKDGKQISSKVEIVNYRKSALQKVVVIPNPANTHFDVILTGIEGEKGTYTILAANGKKIAQSQFTGNVIGVDSKDYSEGVYTIQIRREGTVITERVVISKK